MARRNSPRRQRAATVAAPRPSARRAAAAVGVAVLDAAAAQARAHLADDVRQIETVLPQPTGDGYQFGRGLLAAGDVTGAIAAFRQAIVDDPRSVDALNGLAVAYDRLGRYDLSRSFYDSALAIDPAAPLVANNLGYSLYLQGEYQAAIPWLQRAARSADPSAAAGSQRLLNLIAVKLRSNAAEASTAIARAEIGAATMTATATNADRAATAAADRAATAPGDRPSRAAEATLPGATAPGVGGATVVVANAHIEAGTGGEQRLVLDPTPVADRALVASLGDAAALTMVSKPWTAADDRAVANEAAAQDREIARAGTADLAELVLAEDAAGAAQEPISFASAGDGFPVTMPAGVDVHPVGVAFVPPAGTIVAVAPVAAKPVAANTVAANTMAANTVAVDPVTTSAVVAIAATAIAAPTAVHAPAPEPGWLLASRRTAGRVTTRAVTGQGPQIASADAFDSDDAQLNAFAARMRALAGPAAAAGAATADSMAVARLEALADLLQRG